jgi:predicted nucleic acid-binding Zn ribbon protein
MECPNCGTWNPDDKDVCWRCQAELPRPIPEKKKRKTSFLGLPIWAWVAIILLLFIGPLLSQCFSAGIQ